MSLEEFGAGLKRKREERGLTLRDVSERTRIHDRYLRAIEAGQVSRLPGDLYARAFVKHYARILSLDPEETVREFDSVVAQTSEVSPRRSRRSRRKSKARRQHRRTIWQGIGVVVVLAIVGILIARMLSL